MEVAGRLAVTVTTALAIACSAPRDDAVLPPVKEMDATREPGNSPAPPGVEAPCTPRNQVEADAATLVALLPASDGQAAQFLIDSLRTTDPGAARFLMCALDDTRPLRSTRFYWLNRDRRIELVSHHDLRTVGDAVALVLGAPRNERRSAQPMLTKPSPR
jgi:hypothetical protein